MHRNLPTSNVIFSYYDGLSSKHLLLCVVDKDGLSIMLFQNAEYAEKEHPEIRLVTNDIDGVYAKVAAKFPELLHPEKAAR